MENVVDLSFFAMLFLGIGVFVYSTSQPKLSRRRSQCMFLGLALCGVALLFVGAATFYLVQTSPQPEIEGWISSVQPSSGAHSLSNFSIATASGEVTYLRARYEGPGLRVGDRARVRYVQYNHALLDLTILSGSYTGWHLHEPKRAWSFGFPIAFGLGLLYAAYRQQRAAHALAHPLG